jgi:hypothetical protein
MRVRGYQEKKDKLVWLKEKHKQFPQNRATSRRENVDQSLRTSAPVITGYRNPLGVTSESFQHPFTFRAIFNTKQQLHYFVPKHVPINPHNICFAFVSKRSEIANHKG